jgi:thiamine biosynthesis lipoprotein
MELDLGGYVKEYAADRVAALLRDAGCSSALVDLGGDLAIAGPHPDGTRG